MTRVMIGMVTGLVLQKLIITIGFLKFLFPGRLAICCLLQAREQSNLGPLDIQPLMEI